MSIGAKVRSEKNMYGPSYELVSLLGTGALGGVFLGESPDGSKIAVKIPHRNLSASSQDRFWQELAVLEKLGKASGGRFFPKAWRCIDDSGRALLCMELAQGNRLVDLAAANQKAIGHLPEDIALPAGIEYVRMIEVLHYTQISCPDRKPNDVYWKTPEGRLLVLDWNVVDLGKDFEAKKEQDLYIFGAMWYELLTGSLPPPLSERIQRPLGKHPYWPEISYGLRRILSKLLAADSKQRYNRPEDARRELEKHWNDFRSSVSMLEEQADMKLHEAHRHLDDGIGLLDKANAARYDQHSAQQYLEDATKAIASLTTLLHEAQRLADLAQRKGSLHGERLLNDAGDLRKEFNKLIATVSQQVMLVRYSAALNYFQAAETAVADDPVAMLNLHRWRLLAEAGRLAIEESDLSLSGHLSTIKPVIDSMERADWANSDGPWRRVAEELKKAGWREDTVSGSYVFSLGREITFWQQWKRAEEAAESHRFGEAAGAYREAGDALQNMPPDYAARILAIVALSADGLADKAKEMTSRQETEGRVRNLLDDCREGLEDGDFSASWQEAERGLQLVSGFPSLSEQRKQLQYYRTLAPLLITLDNAREGKNWLSVLGVMKEMAATEEIPIPAREDQTAWRKVQSAMQDILDFLYDAFGENHNAPWQNIKTITEAQRASAVLSELKSLNESYGVWMMNASKSRSATYKGDIIL